MPTLILSPKYSSDSRSLRAAAERSGWAVMRLAGEHIPTTVTDSDLALYGEISFIERVARSRDIALMSPTQDWLTTIPAAYVQRSLALATLDEAQQLTEEAFIKTAHERKAFPAGIYPTGAALRAITLDIPTDLPVIIAEPVVWEIELRCFVRERALMTLSPYLRAGALARHADGTWPLTMSEYNEARAFATAILSDANVALPPAVALDIGKIAGRGWAIIELNSAWAAGIYGCDATAILPVLARASVPTIALNAADRLWLA